jgi:hypothetical protein
MKLVIQSRNTLGLTAIDVVPAVHGPDFAIDELIGSPSNQTREIGCSERRQGQREERQGGENGELHIE